MSSRHSRLSTYKLFKCGGPSLSAPVKHYIISTGELKITLISCVFWGEGGGEALCGQARGETETSAPVSPLAAWQLTSVSFGGAPSLWGRTRMLQAAYSKTWHHSWRAVAARAGASTCTGGITQQRGLRNTETCTWGANFANYIWFKN